MYVCISGDMSIMTYTSSSVSFFGGGGDFENSREKRKKKQTVGSIIEKFATPRATPRCQRENQERESESEEEEEERAPTRLITAPRSERARREELIFREAERERA